jgi:N-methylhydantoinase A
MLCGAALTSERVLRERDALIAEACAALAGTPSRQRIRYELRYRGQSFELSIEESGSVDPALLREAFARAHEVRYGYRDEWAEVELVNIRVSVWGDSPRLRPLAGADGDAAASTAPIVFDGEPLAATVLLGELAPGRRVSGPALCALPEATLLVPPGWSGVVDAHGTCALEDRG